MRTCGVTPLNIFLRDEDSHFWVNRAFERFWNAVGPERFGCFPDLGSVLRYLNLCLYSVVADEVRARRRTPTTPLEESIDLPAVSASEEQVVAQLAGAELWQAVLRELRTPDEIIVARLAFVRGLRPSAIVRSRPDRFRDVADVYRIKRNIVERLRYRLRLPIASGSAPRGRGRPLDDPVA